MATPATAQTQSVDAVSDELIQSRQRPLLIMYYPEDSYMTEADVRDSYQELRRGGCTKENPLAVLDLLLHTNGGDPVAGYKIAQTVRSMTQHLVVLVPERAYSAGTLLSFAADEIRLGDYAGLSPIDITLTEAPHKGRVQLAAIDSFMDFAKRARKQIEEELSKLDRGCATSSVDSDLLVQMVKEVGALTVGRYYRERKLTGHYSEILLDSYMFDGVSNGRDRRNDVIAKFLFGAPAHEFHLDYHLCQSWHLMAEQMPTAESDLSLRVVDTLSTFTDNGLICQKLNYRMRMPFIRFYPFVQPTATQTLSGGDQNVSTS